MTSSNFEVLRRSRARIIAFCQRHFPSVMSFYASPGPSFKLNESDHIDAGVVTHLTTAATCIESLETCPPAYRPQVHTLDEIVRNFSSAAIRHTRWKSDGAADIYCRCRGLPAVISYITDSDFSANEAKVAAHLKPIWMQVKNDQFGIGELDYPPNSFHTYWALRTYGIIHKRFPNFWPEGMARISRKIPLVLLWTQQVLGSQVALHQIGSSHRDSDQLAWAISTLLEFSPQPMVEKDMEAITVALDCVFSTQAEYGGWPRFEPLFHYPHAGNAYCYTYETFAVLLRCTLLPGREFFRRALAKHRDRLLLMLDNAERTKIALSGSNMVGWCSGHHPNRVKPEGWATASVFQYAQMLRQLFGIWSREAAEADLGVRPATLTEDKACAEIRSRGQVWVPPEYQPARYLMSLFVNPVNLSKMLNPLELDPDAQLIRDEQARSAILFGPAGTSKTSLVAAVASAIGWNYLPIHSSHFVLDGLPNVQARADWIFSRLMELDHCVVLFDEIDELVRVRDEEGADIFGRFLTTSMLPLIAELWRQGRILYFVATNLLKHFDEAVTRSQRFDSRVFVAPPSYEAKTNRLKILLGGDVEIELTENTITEQLEQVKRIAKDKKGNDSLPDEFSLAKFVLMRWDQLDELAYRLKSVLSASTNRVTREHMRTVLASMSDRNISAFESYREYFEQLDAIGRDFARRAVWKLNVFGAAPPLGQLERFGKVIQVGSPAITWLETTGLERAEYYAPPQFHCREKQFGEFEITRA